MCYSLLLKPWPIEIVDLPNLKMGGFSSSQTVSLPEGKYLDTHEYVDMETTSSASPYITHGDLNIFWTGNFPGRIPGNAPTSRPRHHHPCR